MRPPPISTLFPYTTLFRSMRERSVRRLPVVDGGRPVGIVSIGDLAEERDPRDRKSTRLNSSHVKISYAVFCLKKKKVAHGTRPTTRSPASAPVASHAARTT